MCVWRGPDLDNRSSCTSSPRSAGKHAPVGMHFMLGECDAATSAPISAQVLAEDRVQAFTPDLQLPHEHARVHWGLLVAHAHDRSHTRCHRLVKQHRSIGPHTLTDMVRREVT